MFYKRNQILKSSVIVTVKGEKHTRNTGRVKILAAIDEAKEQKKIDFVNNHACKTWRLEQIYDEVFDVLNGGIGDIKKMGDYLRVFHADVMKEEGDVLVEMGLESKEVNSLVSKVARDYMLSRLDGEVGV